MCSNVKQSDNFDIGLLSEEAPTEIESGGWDSFYNEAKAFELAPEPGDSYVTRELPAADCLSVEDIYELLPEAYSESSISSYTPSMSCMATVPDLKSGLWCIIQRLREREDSQSFVDTITEYLLLHMTQTEGDCQDQAIRSFVSSYSSYFYKHATKLMMAGQRDLAESMGQLCMMSELNLAQA